MTSYSELLIRLELTTSSLPRKCSTTELQQHYSHSFRERVHKSTQDFLICKFFSKKNIPSIQNNKALNTYVRCLMSLLKYYK